MAVTYDYYRIFYYVARYHSFTRAAKILENSQPNITRAMNNLEHELGCRLFLRTHRGVTLTPEGERLLAHVEIAQEQLLAGEAELCSARSLESGRISIGVSEIALHGLLLPVLQEFHRAHPGIRIQITNQSSPQAAEAVRTGAVELAVITTPVSLDRPLTAEALSEFREILAAGPGFSGMAGRPVRFSELREYPMVGLGKETGTWEFYDGLFEKCGLTWKTDIEVATMDQILPMIKYDLGLGFLPEFFAKDALDAGEVMKLDLEESIPARQICLVRDANRAMSAAAREFVRLLRAHGEGKI